MVDVMSSGGSGYLERSYKKIYYRICLGLKLRISDNDFLWDFLLFLSEECMLGKVEKNLKVFFGYVCLWVEIR